MVPHWPALPIRTKEVELNDEENPFSAKNPVQAVTRL